MDKDTAAPAQSGMTEAEIRESNEVLDQALADFYAAAPAQSGEQGWAFKCEGKLWVVTDPGITAKWKAQGFEVTPVAAPQPSQTAVVLDDERAAFEAHMNEPCAEGSPVSRRSMMRNRTHAELMWEGWKLRAAFPQPVAQPVEQTRALTKSENKS